MNLEKICKQYSLFEDSRPFDLSASTMHSISKLKIVGAVAAAAKEAALLNKDQGDGALMRITPLAVWASEVPDIDLYYKLIKAHTELTHSNPVVIDSCFVYC